MNRPRVLLANEHRVLREALAKLLEPACEIVGCVADGYELVGVAKELEPDVVVLDFEIPHLNGLGAARILKRSNPDVKLVFVTSNDEPGLVIEAFRVGASGVLLKNSAALELQLAIDQALRGRIYVTPIAKKWLVNPVAQETTARRRKDATSPRQREVLQLLTEGHTMKEIGRRLNITSRTVAFHKYTMMKQHGINSTAELVQFAIKHRLVSN